MPAGTAQQLHAGVGPEYTRLPALVPWCPTTYPVAFPVALGIADMGFSKWCGLQRHLWPTARMYRLEVSFSFGRRGIEAAPKFPGAATEPLRT